MQNMQTKKVRLSNVFGEYGAIIAFVALFVVNALLPTISCRCEPCGIFLPSVARLFFWRWA